MSEQLIIRRPPGRRPSSMICCHPANQIAWRESQKKGVWLLDQSRLDIQVRTPTGVLRIILSRGYATDFRSGPSLINPFIPKIGDLDTALCWIVHDVLYHGYVSREWADSILRDGLIVAGMSKIKANAVYACTRLAGASHYNHLEDDQGELYNANKLRYIKFEWGTKTVR